MNIIANTKLYCEAALLDIAVRIELAAVEALRSLGLPVNEEPLKKARITQRNLSPLYVRIIRIKGRMWHDMYEDHPGYAYFQTDYWEDSHLDMHIGIAHAKSLGLEIFNKSLVKFKGTEEESGPCEGDFYPESIILLSQFDQVLQEFDGTKWIDDLPTQDRYAEFEKEIARLFSESFEESRWDNFDSSRRLSNSANALKRRLEMSQMFGRAIQ